MVPLSVTAGLRRLIAVLMAVAGVLAVGAVGGSTSATAVIDPTYPTAYYVALGDSYSSGTGAKASNERYTDETCRRSTSSYPVRYDQFGRSRGYELLFLNRTCHGADAGGIISNQVPSIVANTRMVTATGGGNDLIAIVNGGPQRLGFSGILTACIASIFDCTVVLDEAAARNAVSKLYGAVKARIQATTPFNQPNVYVLGYPRIFSADGCSGISRTEAATLNAVTEQFDNVIRQEVGKAGFVYVDTLNVFAGHESCTNDFWVHDIETEFPSMDKGESYHPTPRGHQALFERLRANVR